jgi:hypothetical protein
MNVLATNLKSDTCYIEQDGFTVRYLDRNHYADSSRDFPMFFQANTEIMSQIGHDYSSLLSFQFVIS